MKTQIEKLQKNFFRCKDCGCNKIHDSVYIHSSCHSYSPTWLHVVKDKYIIVECAECGKEITRFNFAEESEAK